MFKNLIVAIVGGLILWVAQDRWKDVPTASYSISDAIEIPSSQGSAESAQEISILNSGRSAVKDISIKVPRTISSYNLTKHSNLIKEQIVSGSNSFELVYPELPKGQKIRMLIRYDGGPINKGYISINHADGNAQAQENQSPSLNYLWVWIAYIFGVLTQSVGDFRRFKRESFLKWADSEKLFRNDKPWFALSVEWPKMQFEAIRQSLLAHNYSSIEQTSYYQLLNRPKPFLLNDDDWADLRKKGVELLMKRFSEEVTTYSNADKLVDLFKLKKPEGLSHESWTKFQESLNSQMQNKLLPKHMNAADFVKILEPNNLTLKGLPELVVSQIRKLAQQDYARYLTDGSIWEIKNDPQIVLKTARFDLLTDEQSASIKKTLLQFARMNGMPSSWAIPELKHFISKEKPEWMGEKEFKSISDLVSKDNSLTDELDVLHDQQAELASRRIENDKLTKRVLAQLDLIDKVLSNPSAVEKIEDYDQTFAAGNRKNLELVATLLKAGNLPVTATS